MRVETFNYNDRDELKSNTYVLVDNNNDAVVFDPSVDYDGIVNYIIKNKLNLKAVCLTHGHFDHMRGVKRLLANFNVPVYIHDIDAELLTDTYKNCSDDYNGEPIIVDVKTKHLKDGDILKLLDEEIRVIHTPYHTSGSVCYYSKNSNILISGDTLFKLTVGRADLPTSCRESGVSTFDKIMSLPKETKVYPGHGMSTTINDEILLNRFVKRI